MSKGRGERRKQTFKKGIHRKKLCESIYGDSVTYHDGIEGKFRDGKIHDHEDDKKTNSEWCGKHNYKLSDEKRFNSLSYKLTEFFEEENNKEAAL